MLKKLRLRFVGIVMLIVTVMLLGIFGLMMQMTRHQLAEESMELMRETLSADPFSSAQLHGEQTRRPYFVLSVSMFGRVTVSDSNGYFDLTDDDALLELLNEALNSDAESGTIKQYDLRWLRAHTLTGQRVIFMDASAEGSTLRSLGRLCVGLFLVAFVVFFGISVLFARWAVKPVERAWDEQRRFVADASHELKTPLTVIMTDAELLQTQEYGEQEQKQLSGSILTMAQQMRGLVEGMLELARLDGTQKEKPRETVDLSAVTEEKALCFEPLFYEKELGFVSEIEPDIKVIGQADKLGQVLEILLDNAQKYSAPMSTAALSLARTGSRQCTLCVASCGETLSKAELKNIFGRFVRLDTVRSMDQSYGLGLSIARSIVTEHRGKIWAESEDGVNRFFVQLPIAN